MYEYMHDKIAARLPNIAPEVLRYLDIKIHGAMEPIEGDNFSGFNYWMDTLSGFLDCLEAQGVITVEENHGLLSELRMAADTAT